MLRPLRTARARTSTQCCEPSGQMLRYSMCNPRPFRWSRLTTSRRPHDRRMNPATILIGDRSSGLRRKTPCRFGGLQRELGRMQLERTEMTGVPARSAAALSFQ